MTPEIDSSIYTGTEINPAIFDGIDSEALTLTARREDRAAKKRRAQIWQQQHAGKSHVLPKPNLEKFGRESARKNPGGFQPPRPH